MTALEKGTANLASAVKWNISSTTLKRQLPSFRCRNALNLFRTVRPDPHRANELIKVASMLQIAFREAILGVVIAPRWPQSVVPFLPGLFCFMMIIFIHYCRSISAPREEVILGPRGTVAVDSACDTTLKCSNLTALCLQTKRVLA